MKVSVRLSGSAYLPEAFAYRDYLAARGHEVALLSPGDGAVPADVEIRFMGLDGRWLPRPRARAGDGAGDGAIVHEYNSLSSGRLPRLKNRFKKLCNIRPTGRIFLNEFVRNDFSFRDSVPYIYRDMGVDRIFFDRAPENPEFDLVYAGAFTRPGFVAEVERLARMGLSLLLVGEVDPWSAERLGRLPGVTLAGRAERHELPGLYARARAGLNFTSDIYPYNLQTSTKTLEYCAARLGVVSNRYAWSVDFARRTNARFLWLERLRTAEDFHAFRFSNVDVSELEWTTVLTRCDFEGFLERLL